MGRKKRSKEWGACENTATDLLLESRSIAAVAANTTPIPHHRREESVNSCPSSRQNLASGGIIEKSAKLKQEQQNEALTRRCDGPVNSPASPRRDARLPPDLVSVPYHVMLHAKIDSRTRLLGLLGSAKEARTLGKARSLYGPRSIAFCLSGGVFKNWARYSTFLHGIITN